MAYTDFKTLYSQGEEGEKMFLKWLRLKDFDDITHIDDVFIEERLSLSDWDYRAKNTKGSVFRFEVKHQPECQNYGYVNVEQLQNGVRSGIAISDSDYWVFVNKELGLGFIETEKLKKQHWFLQRKATTMNYRRGDTINGVKLWKTDYDNPACGFLININELKWIKI